jgi:sugar phosphate isomerase/epimerase
MQNRRDFIKNAAFFTAAATIVPNLTMAENVNYAGIQLWTVKDFMEKDPKETLAKIAKMGYKEVESFGGDYFGYGPGEFKKYINSLGMKMRSAHVALGKGKATDPTPGNIQESIDKSAEAGLTYMVLPWSDRNTRDTADNCKRTADYFNEYGALCKKAGMKFAFHNHDAEFEIIEGKPAYDYWLENTDPTLVYFEMDLFWVTMAGKDPVDYFKRFPGRFPLWHVKDKHPTKKESTEIGNGTIDFQRIFNKSKLAGLELAIVEQEAFVSSSLESAETCLKNIKKLRL